MSSKSRKLIIIAALLITSQLLRVVIESTYTGSLEPSNNDNDVINKVTQEKIVAGASESLVSGRYVVRHFYKSEGFGRNDVTPDDVTLVLHGTVDKMYDLIELAEVWDGPVSVSVLAPGTDASFLDDAIDGVRLCWSVLRHTTSFHLVYPMEAPANMSAVGSFVYLSCKDIIRRLRIRKPRSIVTSQYPHNAMRNVARRGVITDFVLHLDAGLLPNKELRSSFLDFAKRNGLRENLSSSREVYVLPVFETRHSSLPVRNKRDLVTSLEDKNARSLFQETCPQCHKSTDHEKWVRSMSYSPGDQMKVSYTVKYTNGWEPFFIAPKNSPIYDDRFTAFGHDRLSHICELQAKGYTFRVLSDGFLTVRGFRTKAKISELARKRRDERRTFAETFRANLKRHGYTDKPYDAC